MKDYSIGKGRGGDHTSFVVRLNPKVHFCAGRPPAFAYHT